MARCIVVAQYLAGRNPVSFCLRGRTVCDGLQSSAAGAEVGGFTQVKHKSGEPEPADSHFDDGFWRGIWEGASPKHVGGGSVRQSEVHMLAA